MTPEKFEKALELASQMATETITLLRADLTDEEKVRALLIGRINFSSAGAQRKR